MVRLESATERSQNLRLQPLRKLGEWGRFVRGVPPAPFHLHAGRRCRGEAQRSPPRKAVSLPLRSKPVARNRTYWHGRQAGQHSAPATSRPSCHATLIHCEPFALLVAPFRDGVNRSAGIVNNDIDQCDDRRSAMHRGAAQQDPGLRPCSGDSHHRTVKGPGQRAIRKRGARDALRDSARSRAPGLDQDSPLLG